MPRSQKNLTHTTALDGVIVVELGARIGAAVCSSLLAQLGAQVVVLELESDFKNFDKSKHRNQLCAGKLSLAPNLREADDQLLVREILARSSVVLTSSDCDRPALLQLMPARSSRQIFCDITAFGQNYAPDRACTDFEVQALVGITHTTGYDKETPAPISLPVLEYLTGMHAAGAVLAALHAVQQEGPGQSIDMALYDAGFAAMSSFLTRNLADGDTVATERIGNRHALSAPWNVYRALDGWIQVCTGSDLQWRRFCALMGCPELADDSRYEKSSGRVANVQEVDAIVQFWMQNQTVKVCLEALNAANIPGGAIAVIDGFPREANLPHRKMILSSTMRPFDKTFYLPGSPFKMSKTPGLALTNIPPRDGDRATIKGLLKAFTISPCTSVAKPAPSLAGLRVIEIGHYTTAPVAARYLASLGADVIKIEPPEGEASRSWPPLQRGQSLFYTLSNSDKRSITLDLNATEGKQCLRSLLETADVLVENLKPGTLAKRGFSSEELERINPRLVYCAISGFGSDSLYAGRPAFDTVVQAMSGVMDLIKTGDVPLKTGISIADLMGAATSVVAILAALICRTRTGQGQSIDLSMQDILGWSTQLAWNGCRAENQAWSVVRCADGYALTSTGDGEATSSRAVFVKACISKGGRAASINTPYEALIAEQTLVRQLWFQLQDARGSWPAFATPLRLLGTPCEVKRAAPELGFDNEEIIGPYLDRPRREERSSHVRLA